MPCLQEVHEMNTYLSVWMFYLRNFWTDLC